MGKRGSNRKTLHRQEKPKFRSMFQASSVSSARGTAATSNMMRLRPALPTRRVASLSVRASARDERHRETTSKHVSGNVNESKRAFLKKLALGTASLGAIATQQGKPALAADQQQTVASSRMSYSRFLEYLDMDRVKKVDFYDNGTSAIVEAVSPEVGNRIQRVRVQLPGIWPFLSRSSAVCSYSRGGSKEVVVQADQGTLSVSPSPKPNFKWNPIRV